MADGSVLLKPRGGLILPLDGLKTRSFEGAGRAGGPSHRGRGAREWLAASGDRAATPTPNLRPQSEEPPRGAAPTARRHPAATQPARRGRDRRRREARQSFRGRTEPSLVIGVACGVWCWRRVATTAERAWSRDFKARRRTPGSAASAQTILGQPQRHAAPRRSMASMGHCRPILNRLSIAPRVKMGKLKPNALPSGAGRRRAAPDSRRRRGGEESRTNSCFRPLQTAPRACRLCFAACCLHLGKAAQAGHSNQTIAVPEARR